MFSSGVYYKFGKKVLTLALLKQLPFTVLCALIVFVSPFFIQVQFAVLSVYGLLFVFIVIFICLAYSLYQYESKQFMFDEFSLRVRSGIFSRKEVAVPYRQIQDVTLEESYVQRMFGVATLSVFTAGHEDSIPNNSDSSGVFFPLIDHSYAVELQQILLKRSNVQAIVAHQEFAEATKS